MRDEFKEINKTVEEHKELIDKFHVVAIPAPCPETPLINDLTFNNEQS